MAFCRMPEEGSRFLARSTQWMAEWLAVAVERRGPAAMTEGSGVPLRESPANRLGSLRSVFSYDLMAEPN